MRIEHLLKTAAPVALAIAAAGCSGGADSAADSAAPRHNVYIVTPAAAGGAASADYSATIEEGKSVSAGFKTGGQLTRIAVDEGDYVRKGQVIAWLDDSDYRLSVRQLEVQYEQMGKEIARLDEMFARGNVAPNDYEKAKAGYEQLRTQLDMTRNKLAYTRLEAPASGYVVERFMEAGEMVGSGTPVVRILDNSTLEASVAIPAEVYARRSEITSATGRTRFTGNRAIPLDIIGFIPDGDNNSLYRLRLRLPSDAKGVLTPGMNMTVSLASGATSDGLAAIPSRSVFEEQGKRWVWTVAPDSVVTRREVTVAGQPDADGNSLVGGLTATDVVVAAGVHHLVDGEKVGVIDHIHNLSKNVGL